MQRELFEFDQNRADQLFKSYITLPAEQQYLLHLFSIIYHFIDINNFTDIAEDGQLTAEDIYEEVHILRDAGFLLTVRNDFSLVKEIREMIFEHLSELPEFPHLCKRVETRYSSSRIPYYTDMREFRIALYTQDTKRVTELFKILTQNSSRNHVSLYLTVFCAPFSQKRLDLLPTAALKLVTLENIFLYLIRNGLPEEKVLTSLIKISEDEFLSPVTEFYVLLYSSWIGKKNIVNRSERTKAVLALYEAVNAVDNRRWNDAEELFHLAEELYKANSFRRTHFPEAAQLYYVVHLLNKNSEREIREFIQTAIMTNHSKEKMGVTRPLIALCRCFMGDLNLQSVNPTDIDPAYSTCFLGAWVRLLCSYWLDDPKFTEKVLAVKIEFENEPLLHYFRDELEFILNGDGTASLLRPQERWEGVLNGLLNLLEPDSSSEEREERLVWRVMNREKDIIFTPVIQKIGRNGKWSAGRQVKFRELKYQFNRLDTLKQDKEILDIGYRIEEFGWRINSTEKSDRQELVRLAIGHPRLFLQKSKKSITLREEKLRVNTQRNGNKITISLEPAAPKSSGMIICGTDTEWTVTFATEEQQKLTSYLNTALEVPADQAMKLSKLFTALSDKIDVEGDTDSLGQDLEIVKGWTKPQFFIEPLDEGLLFNMKAVPSEENQLFLPGKGKDEYIGHRNDSSVRVVRDLAEERTVALKIIDSISLLAVNDSGEFQWPVYDPIEALEILQQLKEHELQPQLNWPRGESMRIVQSYSSTDLFQTVKKERDWFEISGSVQIDNGRVLTLKQLMALSEGSESRFVRLAHGEYLALTRALKQELETITTYSQKSRGDSVKLHPLALLPFENSSIAKEFSHTKEWIEQFKQNHSKKYPTPKGVKVELRDYQEEGYEWMMSLASSEAGALLADDMGLGKTVQAIVMLAARKDTGPALIVVPASLSFNWLDEINRFAPSLNAQLLQSESRESQIKNLSSGDILITSYGLVQRNEELFTSREWATFILDEAQAVKNNTTKRTKIIKSIPRKFTLITTGTPVENHLGELWNLFDIILPGFLGTVQNFREKFQVPIEKNENRAVKNRLKRLISPFILRRTKEEVLTELPSKTEINITVHRSADEQAFYEAVRQRAVERLSEDNSQDDRRFAVLAEITRLRQACCHPKLLDKKSTIGSAKLKLFAEKVEELIEGSHQALVFSQFTGYLKLIENFLKEKKIPYFYLDGSIPAKDRGKLVKGFQSGERPIFLISLKAGGSGLNLTNADYVFHMDPWWNPAAEDQASDRAHRIGQERPVTVYRFIAANSIEEQIISLHQEKRNLAESLLSESATSLKLNTDELISIISGK